jgi:hypothetical protein
LQDKGKLLHLTGIALTEITTKLTGTVLTENTTEPIGTDNTIPVGKNQKPQTTILAKKIIITKKDPHWNQNDINDMNWLLNSMEPQISRLFMYCESAKEIWEETKEIFDQKQNFTYIFHLKQEMSQTTKMITEYYGTTKSKMTTE